MIAKSKKNEERQVHPLELLLPKHLLAVGVHFLFNCAQCPIQTVQTCTHFCPLTQDLVTFPPPGERFCSSNNTVDLMSPGAEQCKCNSNYYLFPHTNLAELCIRNSLDSMEHRGCCSAWRRCTLIILF